MSEPRKEIAETPLMKQHNAIKAKYPDALLLFRVGDFYETFGEDAVKASGILGIVLTKRANGAAQYIELAGFPHHALDTYLPKLVKAGLRVAICDQLEDPKLTKKIVKRGITELVTPGVATNDKVLAHKENNFLAGIHMGPRVTGVAFVDISTGEFYVAQGSQEYADNLLQSMRPMEVVVQKNRLREFKETYGDKFYTATFEDWVFTPDFAKDVLQKHFGTTSLKGFGVEEMEAGVIASGAALHYLAETQHDKVSHISKLSRIEEDHYVWLDKFTVRNLELLHGSNENSLTLIDVTDHTLTPMGSRLLKRWMVMPLKDKLLIDERLDITEEFIGKGEEAEALRREVKGIGDLERLIGKVAIGKIQPREVLQIKRALTSVEAIKLQFTESGNTALRKIGEQLNACRMIRDRIEHDLHADPPALALKRCSTTPCVCACPPTDSAESSMRLRVEEARGYPYR